VGGDGFSFGLVYLGFAGPPVAVDVAVVVVVVVAAATTAGTDGSSSGCGAAKGKRNEFVCVRAVSRGRRFRETCRGRVDRASRERERDKEQESRVVRSDAISNAVAARPSEAFQT